MFSYVLSLGLPDNSDCFRLSFFNTNVKPQILTCRFLLNLRQLHGGSRDNTLPLSSFASLRFQVETRVVANMDQSLRDDEEEGAEDQLEGHQEDVRLNSLSLSEDSDHNKYTIEAIQT